MIMMYAFCRSKLMYTKCIQNVYHISTNFCIHFVRKMYTKCMQNVCIQNISCISTNICFQMYAKCMYTKCLLQFDNFLYTFCIQNLASIVLLILYTKCIQKFVKMWYTFCIHFVYISCIHLYIYTLYILKLLHTQCSTKESNKTASFAEHLKLQE